MNKGSICISLCAPTIDELRTKIEQTAGSADIVEIRFDRLSPAEFESPGILPPDKFEQLLKAAKTPILTTFRTKDQGGDRELTSEERINFWSTGYETELCDLEEDMVEDSWNWIWDDRICSYHDFTGVPDDLEEIFERLSETGVGIVKIAVQANDITDTIAVWKLLEKAKKAGKRVIPIAMGEAGKWTRILGLAHGAFLTYASLDPAGATAPGQVTADDLINVYRAKELNRNTEVYGIIAGNTSYSLSPYTHNAAFSAANMDRVFVPLQVADIDSFMERMVKPATCEIDLNFRGFAVTNPHKQTIIPHLDELDRTAVVIGAVNTVRIRDGKLYGYNTDALGFIEPLKARFGNLNDARVALFGAGGAARACIYSLQKEGASVSLFVRDAEKASPLAEEFGVNIELTGSKDLGSLLADFDILVNATPLGTKGPGENETVARAEHLRQVKLVYDLNYNPFDTLLIREAQKADVPFIGGLEMLIEQAEQQYRIWTGNSGAASIMRAVALKKLQQ